jgi:hypothetical protein
MPGFEPGTFHMQSEHSTTELHPPWYITGVLIYLATDDDKPPGEVLDI